MSKETRRISVKNLADQFDKVEATIKDREALYTTNRLRSVVGSVRDEEHLAPGSEDHYIGEYNIGTRRNPEWIMYGEDPSADVIINEKRAHVQNRAKRLVEGSDVKNKSLKERKDDLKGQLEVLVFSTLQTLDQQVERGLVLRETVESHREKYGRFLPTPELQGSVTTQTFESTAADEDQDDVNEKREPIIDTPDDTSKDLEAELPTTSIDKTKKRVIVNGNERRFREGAMWRFFLSLTERHNEYISSEELSELVKEAGFQKDNTEAIDAGRIWSILKLSLKTENDEENIVESTGRGQNARYRLRTRVEFTEERVSEGTKAPEQRKAEEVKQPTEKRGPHREKVSITLSDHKEISVNKGSRAERIIQALREAEDNNRLVSRDELYKIITGNSARGLEGKKISQTVAFELTLIRPLLKELGWNIETATGTGKGQPGQYELAPLTEKNRKAAPQKRTPEKSKSESVKKGPAPLPLRPLTDIPQLSPSERRNILPAIQATTLSDIILEAEQKATLQNFEEIKAICTELHEQSSRTYNGRRYDEERTDTLRHVGQLLLIHRESPLNFTEIQNQKIAKLLKWTLTENQAFLVSAIDTHADRVSYNMSARTELHLLARRLQSKLGVQLPIEPANDDTSTKKDVEPATPLEEGVKRKIEEKVYSYARMVDSKIPIGRKVTLKDVKSAFKELGFAKDWNPDVMHLAHNEGVIQLGIAKGEVVNWNTMYTAKDVIGAWLYFSSGSEMQQLLDGLKDLKIIRKIINQQYEKYLIDKPTKR